MFWLYFIEQVLDEYSPATESAVDTMSVTCEAITLREKTVYWKKDGSGNLAPPEEIGNNLCPNQCSGNGVCSNGKCICSNDFITADCSLKKGKFFWNLSEKYLTGKGIAFRQEANCLLPSL